MVISVLYYSYYTLVGKFWLGKCKPLRETQSVCNYQNYQIHIDTIIYWIEMVDSSHRYQTAGKTELIVGSLIFVLLFGQFLPIFSQILPLLSKIWIFDYQWKQVGIIGSVLFKPTFATIAEEERKITAEHQAFSAFEREVQAIKIPTENIFRKSSQPVQTFETTENRGEIITAYAQTIMAVPHYQDEYDESIEESLVQEFSPEIRTALLTNTMLTPTVKSSLLMHIHQAKEKRIDFLKLLEQEKASLESVSKTIQAIQLSEGNRIPTDQDSDIYPVYCDLTNAEEKLTRLHQKRQRDIHSINRNRQTNASQPLLQEYLYQSLSSPFPGLMKTLEIIQSLRKQKQTLAEIILSME